MYYVFITVVYKLVMDPCYVGSPICFPMTQVIELTGSNKLISFSLDDKKIGNNNRWTKLNKNAHDNLEKNIFPNKDKWYSLILNPLNTEGWSSIKKTPKKIRSSQSELAWQTYNLLIKVKPS
jgi:hypothetical protein